MRLSSLLRVRAILDVSLVLPSPAKVWLDQSCAAGELKEVVTSKTSWLPFMGREAIRHELCGFAGLRVCFRSLQPEIPKFSTEWNTFCSYLHGSTSLKEE